MNTEDEALKLALEALRLYQRTLAPADTQCKGVAAVAAIEQALAVQQQCKWPTCQSEEYQQALAEQINQELVTGAAQPLHALRSAIANDAWAISFQSLGQYRSALLQLIDANQPAAPVQPEQVPVAELLKQSRANFDHNFGKAGQGWADWIYADLLELLTTPPAAAPVQPGQNHYEDGDVFERIAAMKKPAAQPAPAPLADGVLKITMQLDGFEVSRLLSLDVIRTSNAPEVDRHSRQAWLDLQKAAHGITGENT